MPSPDPEYDDAGCACTKTQKIVICSVLGITTAALIAVTVVLLVDLFKDERPYPVWSYNLRQNCVDPDNCLQSCNLVVTSVDADMFWDGTESFDVSYDGWMSVQFNTDRQRVVETIQDTDDDGSITVSCKVPDLVGDSCVSSTIYNEAGGASWYYAIGFVADLEQETLDAWLRVANENMGHIDTCFGDPSAV
ncbi:hypothetical protein KIPB_009020 [Kipferlia bialata]|uniref:Uncharacterized protein n=1 Tax=Kipferlia bialata TaxID=797122 RepID=A0A9K3D3Q4_9EUKA|nr:hypothetical protein KIPB_009020 [Kipferlia bialata]|eukprot:g9020.t1